MCFHSGVVPKVFEKADFAFRPGIRVAVRCPSSFSDLLVLGFFSAVCVLFHFTSSNF